MGKHEGEAFSDTAPRGLPWIIQFEGARAGSAEVEGQRNLAEQRLEGPAAGEVNANAAGGVAYAGADFEKLGAESFDLGGAPRLR